MTAQDGANALDEIELPQLLRYMRGEAVLDAALSRLKVPGMRELLHKMTQRDPSHRPTAAKCLQMARGSVLDDCFYSFASGFFGRLRLMDQHAQAQIETERHDHPGKSEHIGRPTHILLHPQHARGWL